MKESMEIIIDDIIDERVYQDKQWGGPKHDDELNGTQWVQILQKRIRHLHDHLNHCNDYAIRPELVQSAAAAIAWIESIDRVERDAEEWVDSLSSKN